MNLNQNVWRDHATMQQDILLHFLVLNQASTPVENSEQGYMEKSYKMQQRVTVYSTGIVTILKP